MPATKLRAKAMPTIFWPAKSPFGTIGCLAPFHSQRTKAAINTIPGSEVSGVLWIGSVIPLTDE